MRRLSSSFTFAYKVVFPAVWLAGFGGATLFLIAGSMATLWRGDALPRELVLMTVMFSIGLAGGLVMISVMSFPLKHVSLVGDLLRVEGLKRKIEVSFLDVAEVRGDKWANPELITLVLK